MSALLSRQGVREIGSVSSPFQLNTLRDTRRNVVVEDKVFSSADGALSFSFNPLFKRNGSTPGIKLSVHGITQAGSRVPPAKAHCVIHFDDRRELSYPVKLEDGTVNLPRTEEPFQLRLSLGFTGKANRPDLVEIKLEDESGRAVSVTSRS